MFVARAELDRIPGDAPALAAGARELDDVAATLLQLAAILDLVADEDVTIGDSVDAMRVRTDEAADGLRDAQPRYAATSAALQEFSVLLHDVQRRFDRARSEVETEEDAVRRFEREVWEIESQAVRLAMLAPDPEQRADDARRLAYLRGELAEHRAARDRAEDALDAAVQEWDAAARHAAGRIRPVLGALNDGLLDRIGAVVEGIGDFLAAVGEWVASILDTVITTVLLLVVVVVTLLVVVVAVVALAPVLLPLFLGGALTLDQIVEILVGVVLVAVPVLTVAVAALMLREQLTPTPAVHPVAPAGGRMVKKGAQSDYQYLFENNNRLDKQGDRDGTVVEIVQVLDEHGRPALDENGNPIWRVTLPSTQDWQLGMGGALGDGGAVNDLGSNLALILTPDQRAAYERAVLQAMHDAGIGPDDSVMLAGWSQGGILAGAIASDPDSGFTIRAIAVAGAPIDHMDIPDSVSVLAFQHDGDHVPRLDGTPPRQGPNWATVNVASAGEGYPHDAGK